MGHYLYMHFSMRNYTVNIYSILVRSRSVSDCLVTPSDCTMAYVTKGLGVLDLQAVFLSLKLNWKDTLQPQKRIHGTGPG